MEINLNFVLVEELEEAAAEATGNCARVVVVRGSLDASFIPEDDWIRLDSIE